MSATDMIYKIIDEKCLKQSAVARAAGYEPKKFNDLLRGRKRMTSDDVVPICKALGITPNELFGIEHTPSQPGKSAGREGRRWRKKQKSPGTPVERRAETTTNWGCTYTAKKITEHWKRHRPFGNSCPGVDGGQKDGCV